MVGIHKEGPVLEMQPVVLFAATSNLAVLPAPSLSSLCRLTASCRHRNASSPVGFFGRSRMRNWGVGGIRCNFFRICEADERKRESRPALFFRQIAHMAPQGGFRLAYPEKIACSPTPCPAGAMPATPCPAGTYSALSCPRSLRPRSLRPRSFCTLSFAILPPSFRRPSFRRPYFCRPYFCPRSFRPLSSSNGLVGAGSTLPLLPPSPLLASSSSRSALSCRGLVLPLPLRAP